MLRVKVFDDMGRTDETLLYETGRPKPVENTRQELSFKGKILSGAFKGDVEVITLSGQFNPKQGTGVIEEWESRVSGDLHYRMSFDDPIRLQSIGRDLAAAPAEGIRFDGNRHENTFNGDIGKDRISGAGGDDELGGLDDNDALDGGAGEDLLSGGDGNDRLSGGDANDGLVGGKGRDNLVGGGGRDLLIGGASQDRLTGGGGTDRFRFGSESDSGTGRKSRDTITDFVSGTDLIDLSPIDARTKSSKDDKFTYIGDQEFSDRAGELRLDRSILSADSDGDGRADFEVLLANDIDVLKDALIL